MIWRNTVDRYGLFAIVFHWLVAGVVIGLFVLGLWMVELDYYDRWYKRGPDLHKSIGILLLLTVMIRLAWRYTDPPPRPLGTEFQQRAASLAHALLYMLLLLLIVSGYLISTADNRAIAVFGWFSIPATISGIENQEDIAGEVHRILAYCLIALSALHALAALKHHFIDRDASLARMLKTGHPLNH